MLKTRYRLLTSLLLLFASVSFSWAQEPVTPTAEEFADRQALVIGNANYAHAGVLRNPANDARAISRTLEQLGFKVRTLTDADERQMDQAIRNFGRRLRGSNGVGLFYYAGHGMQIEGQNYLLPTDINPSNEFDVTYDAVPVGKLLGQMQVAENGMNIVILDACRNNPFARSFRSSSRGLAQLIAPTGSFISYATAPGNVAADGEGDNGLFTEKLVQHMTTPGLKLEEVFKRVRADVQQDSSNKQVPWDSSSVTGDFFFVPAEGVVAAKPKVVDPSTTSSDQDFAAQAWEVIKDSKDPELLEEFIKLFPEAPQRNLARLKLMAIKSSDSKNTSVANTPTTKTEPVATKTTSAPSAASSDTLSGDAAIKKLLGTNECNNCDLLEANLSQANLYKASLTEANLRGAILYKASLTEANLRGAILYKASLTEANLRGANLHQANLRQAILRKANLSQANLRGANLSDGNLRGTDLSQANLRGANLSQATLYMVNLRRANLRGANLIGADLIGADFYEANLYEADLLWANPGAAKFCNTTMPDGAINNQDC